MRKLLLVIVMLVLPLAAFAVTNSFTIAVTTTFTPLHTYFMAATGCNDANSGTSAGSPWCNPDNNGHVSLVCGDVIIAAAGTYTQMAPANSPSTCPSSSGGIDGAGGIYFAVVLCGGSDLEACKITNASANAVELDTVNNWAFEGFKVTNSGPNARAFESRNCNTTGTTAHHHAMINNVVFNSNQGFGMNDCGLTNSLSVDYWAVVGNIAQNAAQDGICLAAIDAVGPGVFDTNAGTHFFANGNFSWSNASTGCTGSDVEAIMFDTWDVHNVNSRGVISNNIAYSSNRFCIQMFFQNNHPNTPTINIYNNTCFRNNLSTNADNMDAEININDTNATLHWIITLTNNIAYQPLAASPTGGGGVAAFAFYFSVTPSSVTNGGTGNENIYKANNSVCSLANCNSGFDAQSDVAAVLGTNTYTNPSFTNTTDLLANQTGTPTCTGFENVTQCMGWNAATSTLTAPSVISDLTPTAGGTSGKGYQKPTMTCTSNADFPAWLKGIVYLHWTGSIVQQRAGLVSVPCGM